MLIHNERGKLNVNINNSFFFTINNYDVILLQEKNELFVLLIKNSQVIID